MKIPHKIIVLIQRQLFCCVVQQSSLKNLVILSTGVMHHAAKNPANADKAITWSGKP